MAESLKINAQWGDRSEPFEVCLERLERYLTGLSGVSVGLDTWFETGTSRQSAKSLPVDVSRESLSKLLLSGQNRRDQVPRTVIEELGYVIALWNGERNSVGLMTHCGAFGDKAHNAVTLSLPVPEDDALALYDPTILERITELTIATWDPEWATVVSNRLRNAQEPGKVVAGWATYLRQSLDSSIVPASLLTRPLGRGTIMVARSAPTETLDAFVDDARGVLHNLRL
jgi:hypothetical protein